MGVAELARHISQLELSCCEVITAFLSRCKSINPAINAITDLKAEWALEKASQADKALQSGADPGPLHGVPFTIKSSIAVEGYLLECGTKLRKGEVANCDATLVERLKKAGAIILGTTNVPEFLMAYETDNYLHGRTNSPLNNAYTPGGSSGGDSAAVAANCCAAGIGSDAGGSVRVPAHFCGLYGLKPSPGVISRSGHWPPVGGPSTTLAAVGPLTKNAEDLDLLLDITGGYDPTDISSFQQNPLSVDRGKLKEIKIGWFDHAWGMPVTRETRNAVSTAAEALCHRGFQVERVELKGLEQAPQTWWLLFGICLKTLIESSIPKGYRLHPLSYEAMASDKQESGTSYQDLLNGWLTQDRLRHHLLEQMQDYPILLCPVAAIPAFEHGQREWAIEGEHVHYPDVFVYSQVFNLLGTPASVAPVSTSPEGMPIGVQIIGMPYEDRMVTAITRELESALQAG